MIKTCIVSIVSLLIGALLSLGLAYKLGETYSNKESDILNTSIKSKLWDYQYNAKFDNYEFSKLYCSENYNEKTITLHLRILQAYFYQYLIDDQLVDMDYKITVELLRLSKMLEVNEDHRSLRSLRLAKVIGGLSNIQIVNDAFRTDFLSQIDINYCQKVPHRRPLP